jgi:predicted nucleic acid-binding protein
VIVVDSAALVDALTAVEGTEELRADLADQELHAPALLDFEVVSALRVNLLASP